jgi:hypothetical protein
MGEMVNKELEDCIDFFFLNDIGKVDINPCSELAGEEYQLYLEYATPDELEYNTITKNTYKKVKGIESVTFNCMGI